MNIDSFMLMQNSWMPNNPRLAVKLYRAVLRQDEPDPAAAFEKLFERNGWPPQWRNGVYTYHHYHSTAHEALGFAAGWAELVLGGPGGRAVHVERGDAVLLPAGTGHFQAKASPDFLVVGAYPPGQQFDICRAAPSAAMLRSIETLAPWDTDPVTGRGKAP